jgi:hypothetical protein
MAVDAAIGSSPRMFAVWGITAATESGEKRKIKNPIMAFQNPATIQGKVIVNKKISTMSTVLKPVGDNAHAARATSPAMVVTNSAATRTRRPVMEFPAASACLD